ncbi:hypothetical protein Syun_001998 [Stephania yunnanensis]|uniref:Uncharacterized protein n=1 Tax=Stephania yunnanensis TaxID=152371 RepID=A0AAP0LER9_9MAGN
MYGLSFGVDGVTRHLERWFRPVRSSIHSTGADTYDHQWVCCDTPVTERIEVSIGEARIGAPDEMPAMIDRPSIAGCDSTKFDDEMKTPEPVLQGQRRPSQPSNPPLQTSVLVSALDWNSDSVSGHCLYHQPFDGTDAEDLTVLVAEMH